MISITEQGNIMDAMIQAIQSGQLHAQNINARYLRQSFMRDEGIQYQLDYGRAILRNEAQLNQYLYSYGLMVMNQWEEMLCQAQALPAMQHDTVRVFDYGCGQALATAMLLDSHLWALWQRQLGRPLHLDQVTLIEPSAVALVRAQNVVACYTRGQVPVKAVNRCLDDLHAHDVVCGEDVLNVHLFSNILDIQTFDLLNLFTRILKQKGRHIFLAVSHDRDFKGGDRLPSLYQALSKLDAEVSPHHSLHRFHCRNGQAAVGFVICVDVK